MSKKDAPQPAAAGFSEMADKMAKAAKLLSQIRDEDVDVGATPKKLVMRRDKVELFRYEPLAPRKIDTPVIIAYGLIGRYTMADLQPDRSLVRSLLSQGLDLWLVDWGQPTRTERCGAHAAQGCGQASECLTKPANLRGHMLLDTDTQLHAAASPRVLCSGQLRR